MIDLVWRGGMEFHAKTSSGNSLVFDSDSDSESKSTGSSPLDFLLAAIAGCTAMDVVSILQKKRQDLQSYSITVEGARPEPGQYPRPFTSIFLRHSFSGTNLDPLAVARAIQLSEEKYCSVLATLRQNPHVVSTWSIETGSLSEQAESEESVSR